MNSPALRVKDLVIKHGKKTVLKISDLSISRTGVTVFVGPSGCGKSSLLSVLADLAGGSLNYEGDLYDGEIPRTLATARLPYSMVWQTPIVFPCSIWDNLSIPLSKRGVPRSERTSHMEAALRKVGLLEELGPLWEDISADRISGGQKQRLCLARCLLQDASVIFLDEPCSSLDIRSCEKVEAVIAELARDRALILVTHSLGQARRLAANAAVFCVNDEGGVLCESGPATSCLFRPSTVEAKSFLMAEVGQ